uniref:RNA-binding domain-containing protein n=1 Tax=Parastrongyloides trichosuri TaxID=131310 RepID=A0A0N4ZBB0_PARTI
MFANYPRQSPNPSNFYRGYPSMNFNVNAASFIPQGNLPGAPYVTQNVSYIQNEGPAQMRKLFIGGLNHETTDEQLREYYSQWGNVVDCIVIRDPATKHSRGFGFVTYQTIQMAEIAMNERPHTINGKVVDPKRAIPREQMLPLTSTNPPHFLECAPSTGCKVTISGIHWDFHTVDGIRTYFDKFGGVEQVEILGNPRGMGFVVFEDKDGADKALACEDDHLINGRRVEIKRDEEDPEATPKTSPSKHTVKLFPNNKNSKNIDKTLNNNDLKDSSDYSDDCSSDNTISTSHSQSTQ